MRYAIVPVKNIARLSTASDELLARHVGMPGMGVIYGPTGFGKTTATAWIVNQVHGVYVRCKKLSTPSSFLGSILQELEVEPAHTCAARVDQIIERLAQTGRPLFVDEADYVAESTRLTDTLRDIHDLSTVPVVLIGMEGVQRKLDRRPQFSGRLAQWVQFQPLDHGDARLVADQLCEIDVADELLDDLVEKAGGEIRRVVVGLTHIEQAARARGLDAMEAKDWKGDYFVGRIAAERRQGKVAGRIGGAA